MAFLMWEKYKSQKIAIIQVSYQQQQQKAMINIS